jgi:hypothetical protein
MHAALESKNLKTGFASLDDDRKVCSNEAVLIAGLEGIGGGKDLPSEGQPLLPDDESHPADEQRAAPEEDTAVGRGRIAGDIFERKHGYIYPFLTVTEYYTDNVFNTPKGKKSDFITIITPGIEISVPRIKIKTIEINTTTVSPGGLALSRFKQDFFTRYQAFLNYKVDIEKYGENDSENRISHKLEGLLQYNLRGGLSIDVFDQYIDAYDDFGTNTKEVPNHYKSNLFGAVLAYDISERFKLRFDYNYNIVDYISSGSEFRDRTDNYYSGYLYYRFQPKTSAFVEYEYITIDYDAGASLDSEETNIYGGLQWEATTKSRGLVKAGYGVKEFKDPEKGRNGGFIFEAQADHRLTPKTTLIFTASRKTNETDIDASFFMVTNSLGAKYMQKLTSKITGSLSFFYINNHYKGDLTYEDETKEREDDLFRFTAAIQYNIKEWLKTGIGYIYARRESNFSAFDYTSNTIFFRITGLMRLF